MKGTLINKVRYLNNYNMKNKIKVISLNTQYSIIEVYKNNKVSKHIVSNNGWITLEKWIDYFETGKKITFLALTSKKKYVIYEV